MISTATPNMSLESFTLELPKSDTAFLRTIVKKMGWSISRRSNVDSTKVKSRRKMSSYERSLDDMANGRINEYASSEEFFKKMGI